MSEHWNTAVTAKLVAEAIAARGVDTAPLLEAADITPEVLADPDGRVQLSQMRTFWQEAVAQSGDPYIGLHAGMTAPQGVYKMFDYLMAYAPTLGESYRRFAVHLGLVNSWIVAGVEEHEDEARMFMSTVWGALPRPSAEYVSAIMLFRTRQFVGTDYALKRVEFQFPEPEGDEHARVLGCEVVYGAPRTEIVLDRATWDMPIAQGDPGLIAVLEEQAARVQANLPQASDTVQSVRTAVAEALAGGDIGLEAIATTLGMSGRTLQRRLSSEGLSYNDLVDELRQETAKQRLADPGLALGEVAYLVGFEEQSSFSRAFKRWTGQSPRAYRKGLR